MIRVFNIPGEAKGKGRPKFARMGNFVKAYTPKDTANYENWVKICYKQAYPGAEKLQGALKMQIFITTAIPASYSKKQKKMAMDNTLRPTKKPDLDNIAKIICDSLNTIAYEDDKQIVCLEVNKYYGETGNVLVQLEEKKDK